CGTGWGLPPYAVLPCLPFFLNLFVAAVRANFFISFHYRSLKIKKAALYQAAWLSTGEDSIKLSETHSFPYCGRPQAGLFQIAPLCYTLNHTLSRKSVQKKARSRKQFFA